MNIVKIKDVILGEGIPKICAPLVESGFDSLIREAGRFTTLPVDVLNHIQGRRGLSVIRF